MPTQSEVILILNIVFVLVIGFFINRMLNASSTFTKNPGDGPVQTKQKFIILKSIVIVACIALAAALINIFFG